MLADGREMKNTLAKLAISPISSISPCKNLHENCKNSENSHISYFSQCIYSKKESMRDNPVERKKEKSEALCRRLGFLNGR